jgi:hypothetical protein
MQPSLCKATPDLKTGTRRASHPGGDLAGHPSCEQVSFCTGLHLRTWRSYLILRCVLRCSFAKKTFTSPHPLPAPLLPPRPPNPVSPPWPRGALAPQQKRRFWSFWGVYLCVWQSPVILSIFLSISCQVSNDMPRLNLGRVEHQPAACLDQFRASRRNVVHTVLMII